MTTTIDLGLQELARDAIDEVARRARAGRRPRSSRSTRATAACSPCTAARSFRESQFNLAVQGERQPGSSFKPFVLAAALDEGSRPQTTFVSEPQLDQHRRQALVGAQLRGLLPRARSNLFDATTHSDNAVYAQLTALVGPKKVAQMAHRLGITSPLDDYFAIGLGVEAVNPLEMARAFSTFANGGERVDGAHPRKPAARGRERSTRRQEDRGERAGREEVIDPNENAILTVDARERRRRRNRPARRARRPARRRQDGHDRELRRRLVRRVHAAARRRGLGRLPEQARRRWTNQFEGGPVAGGTYPALIWKSS